MPRRQTPRLAYCEYVQPDPSASTATWQARLLLIDAVKRVYPTMLKRLSADVYPAYADLAKSGFDFDFILWNARVSPHTMLPEPGKKELKVEKETGRVDFVYYSPKLKIELMRWAN